jgi:hypothetical protein
MLLDDALPGVPCLRRLNDSPPTTDLDALSRFRANNTCRLKPLLSDSLACHDIEAFDEMMHQIWHSLCRFAEVKRASKVEIHERV